MQPLIHKTARTPLTYEKIMGIKYMNHTKKDLADNICLYERLLKDATDKLYEAELKMKIYQEKLENAGIDSDMTERELEDYSINIEAYLQTNMRNILFKKVRQTDELRNILSFEIAKLLEENPTEVSLRIISAKNTIKALHYAEIQAGCNARLHPREKYLAIKDIRNLKKKAVDDLNMAKREFEKFDKETQMKYEKIEQEELHNEYKIDNSDDIFANVMGSVLGDEE